MQERRILSKLEDDYGTIDGHDYIKIGNIKWATKPIGSTYDVDTVINGNYPKLWPNANYFQWGDTSINTVGSSSGLKYFDWADYKYCNGDYNSITKYNSTDKKKMLESGDDAATVLWGDNWRMPTKEELQTLNNTDFTVSDIRVESGSTYRYFKLLTYKADPSKQLILPLVSYAHAGTIHYNVGNSTDFLSKDLYNSYNGRAAYTLNVGTRSENPQCPVISSKNRNGGFPILPVVNSKYTFIIHIGTDFSGESVTITGSGGNYETVVVNALGDIITELVIGTYVLSSETILFYENNIECYEDIEKSILCCHVQYVDLGLPSGKKWTTGNLLKNSDGRYYIGNETDYGTIISWGNIEGHDSSENYFTESNYKNSNGNKLTGNLSNASNDIFIANFPGSGLHLPTQQEFYELYSYTDREWINNYNDTGINGIKFMKKTDHSIYIFIPASGIKYDTSTYGSGNVYLWSSTYSGKMSDINRALLLYVSNSTVQTLTNYGFYGLPIRAIKG